MRRNHRIGFTDETKSILSNDAMNPALEAERLEALAKAKAYCLSPEGKLSTATEESRLRTLYNSFLQNTQLHEEHGSKERAFVASFLFPLFDIDRSGTIDRHEVASILPFLDGERDVDPAEVLAEIDPRNSGQVHLPELLAWYDRLRKDKLSRKKKKHRLPFTMKKDTARESTKEKDPCPELAVVLVGLKFRINAERAPVDLKDVLWQHVNDYCVSPTGKKEIDAEEERLHAWVQTFKESHKHLSSKSDQKRARVASLFKRFDLDGSKTIKADALRELLHFLGYPTDNINTILSLINKDGSGIIQESEFLRWYDDRRGTSARGVHIKLPMDKKRRQRDLAHALVAARYRYRHETSGTSSTSLTDLVHLKENTSKRRVKHEEGHTVKADAFCDSDLGQEAIEAEEARLVAMEAGFKAATKGKSKAEKEQARVAFWFRIFDIDGSRSIDVLELGQLLRFLEYPHDKANVEKILASINIDGSGHIHEEEFTAWYLKDIQAKHGVSFYLKKQKEILVQKFERGRAKELARRLVAEKYRQDHIPATDVNDVVKVVGIDSISTRRIDIEDTMVSTGATTSKHEDIVNSQIGQRAISAEVVRLQQLDEAFLASSRHLSPYEHKRARAACIFQWLDVDDDHCIDADTLTVLQATLQLNDQGLAQKEKITESVFFTWFDKVYSTEPTPKRLPSFKFSNGKERSVATKLTKDKLLTLASAIVVSKNRQDPSNVLAAEHAVDILVKSEKFWDSDLGQKAIQAEETRLVAMEAELKAATKGKSKAEKEQARVAFWFRIFDIDGSRSIDVLELGQLLRFLEYPNDKANVEKILASINIDGSGHIHEEEFTAWYLKDIQAKHGVSFQLKKQQAVFIRKFERGRTKELARRLVAAKYQISP